MFKGAKQYYKLTLPKIEMVPEEKQLWQSYRADDIVNFLHNLIRLKEADIDLSYKSLDVR